MARPAPAPLVWAWLPVPGGDHQLRLPGPLLVEVVHLLPAVEDALQVQLRSVQPGGAGEQVVDGHLLGDLLGEARQVGAHRVRQVHLALLRQLQDGHRQERLDPRGEVDRDALVVVDPLLLVGHAVAAGQHSPALVRQQHHAGELVLGGQLRHVPVVGSAGQGVRRDVGVGWGWGGVAELGAHQRRAGRHHASGRQPTPSEQPPPVDTTYGIRVHDHNPFLIDKLTVDALWSMPPLKPQDCCGGVSDFRYGRDTSQSPVSRNWRQAGSEMVPPLVIATA
jgi:hypothetical protein